MRRICDEIFGAVNYIDTIIWKKRYGGGAKEKWFVTLQEYTLVYCKNAANLGELFIPLTKENIERYYQKKDANYAERGGYRKIKQHAEKKLGGYNWKIDLVLSHTCPQKYVPIEAFMPGLDQAFVDHSTEEWLDQIEDKLDYNAWFCGHWHIDKRIDKMHFLMHSIEAL